MGFDTVQPDDSVFLPMQPRFRLCAPFLFTSCLLYRRMKRAFERFLPVFLIFGNTCPIRGRSALRFCGIRQLCGRECRPYILILHGKSSLCKSDCHRFLAGDNQGLAFLMPVIQYLHGAWFVSVFGLTQICFKRKSPTSRGLLDWTNLDPGIGSQRGA